MNFKIFMEIFEAEIDKITVCLPFIRHLLKSNPTDIEFLHIFEDIANSPYKDYVWTASLQLSYIPLINWLLDQETPIKIFTQIFCCKNIKLIKKYISNLPRTTHSQLVELALDTTVTDPHVWEILWESVSVNKNNTWLSLAHKTFIHLSFSKNALLVYVILEKKLRRNNIKTILNSIDIIPTLAQFTDKDTFSWIWQLTLKKPFSQKINNSKQEMSILGFALSNTDTDVFQYLVKDISVKRKAIFKELWYTPLQLRIVYEYLFSLTTLNWQDKFMRFRMLYKIVEGDHQFCCQNCKTVHKISGNTTRHLFADRILLIPMETIEQFEQVIGWLAEIEAIIHWDVVKYAYPFLKEKCKLLNKFIPLVEGKFRYKIITWGLIVPFGGCARNNAFQQLSNSFKPKQSWWYGMLATLFIQEQDTDKPDCNICGDNLATCLDHRISWWMGHGFNINGKMTNNNILAVAINMELSKTLQHRLILAGADSALAHQLLGIVYEDNIIADTADTTDTTDAADITDTQIIEKDNTNDNTLRHTKQLRTVLDEFFHFVAVQLS